MLLTPSLNFVWPAALWYDGGTVGKVETDEIDCWIDASYEFSTHSFVAKPRSFSWDEASLLHCQNNKFEMIPRPFKTNKICVFKFTCHQKLQGKYFSFKTGYLIFTSGFSNVSSLFILYTTFFYGYKYGLLLVKVSLIFLEK